MRVRAKNDMLGTETAARPARLREEEESLYPNAQVVIPRFSGDTDNACCKNSASLSVSVAKLRAMEHGISHVEYEH